MPRRMSQCHLSLCSHYSESCFDSRVSWWLSTTNYPATLWDPVLNHRVVKSVTAVLIPNTGHFSVARALPLSYFEVYDTLLFNYSLLTEPYNRVFLSSLNATLYPLINISPPRTFDNNHCLLWQSLTFLESIYKWDHMAFVFLGLAECVNFKIFGRENMWIIKILSKS